LLDRSFEVAAPNCKRIANFTLVWKTEGSLYVSPSSISYGGWLVDERSDYCAAH
jgi:hypothetical protein